MSRDNSNETVNNTEIFRKNIHDIRGALTIIQLYLNTWEDSLNTDQEEGAQVMQAEIDKIKKLLDNLNDLQKKANFLADAS